MQKLNIIGTVIIECNTPRRRWKISSYWKIRVAKPTELSKWSYIFASHEVYFILFFFEFIIQTPQIGLINNCLGCVFCILHILHKFAWVYYKSKLLYNNKFVVFFAPILFSETWATPDWRHWRKSSSYWRIRVWSLFNKPPPPGKKVQKNTPMLFR